MRTALVLPYEMWGIIKSHLFRSTEHERMGIVLAGTAQDDQELRLLGRSYIPLEAEDFTRQGPASLQVKKDVARKIAAFCAEHGLSQVDFHTHPFDESASVSFSGTDTLYERQAAAYFHSRIPGTQYASVVMGSKSLNARIWLEGSGTPSTLDQIRFLEHPIETLSLTASKKHDQEALEEMHHRQILAFGAEGQKRLSHLRVAVAGAGGIGSIIIEKLARLGVDTFNIIDSDVCELSNLNRVAGMTLRDAHLSLSKTSIMRRLIRSINPNASVTARKKNVLEQEVLKDLRFSDLIITATDNHSTRMALQNLAAQYLIPLVHVGTHISALEEGTIGDISTEYALYIPGSWCLFCAGIIDRQMAGWELSHPVDQQRWIDRGYVKGADIPSPAVAHTNGIIANMAVAEIHNLFSPYRRLHKYVVYDQLKNEIMNIEVEQNPSCLCCSHKGMLGLGDSEAIPDYFKDSRREPALPPSAPCSDTREDLIIVPMKG